MLLENGLKVGRQAAFISRQNNAYAGVACFLRVVYQETCNTIMCQQELCLRGVFRCLLGRSLEV